MSKESDLFVREIKASVESWRVNAETESLYKRKLASWKLTRNQWAAALENIIKANTSGNLPTLSTIYDELRRQREAIKARNFGWMMFNSNNRRHFIRVMVISGEWLNAPWSYTDSNNQTAVLQQHPGEKPKLPADATDITILPDYPVPDVHQASKEDARSCFLRGWLSSGATMQKLPEYLKIIQNEEIPLNEIPF